MTETKLSSAVEAVKEEYAPQIERAAELRAEGVAMRDKALGMAAAAMHDPAVAAHANSLHLLATRMIDKADIDHRAAWGMIEMTIRCEAEAEYRAARLHPRAREEEPGLVTITDAQDSAVAGGLRIAAVVMLIVAAIVAMVSWLS